MLFIKPLRGCLAPSQSVYMRHRAEKIRSHQELMAVHGHCLGDITERTPSSVRPACPIERGGVAGLLRSRYDVRGCALLSVHPCAALAATMSRIACARDRAARACRRVCQVTAAS